MVSANRRHVATRKFLLEIDEYRQRMEDADFVSFREDKCFGLDIRQKKTMLTVAFLMNHTLRKTSKNDIKFNPVSQISSHAEMK